MGDLSRTETHRLHTLESVIGQAIRLHLQAAQALLEIRSRKLYRSSHDTFETYCAERWGISRQHGYRLTGWAEVSNNVSPVGDIQHESHARHLVKLAPRQQVKVWRKVQRSGHITEDTIRSAIQGIEQPTNGENHSGLDGSPIGYIGGKSGLAKKFINLFPKHECYIEGFFGGGSVFFAKAPSKIEIINDVSDQVVNFFTILRDHGKELQRRLKLTPHARTEHEKCRSNPITRDPIENARRFYVRTAQSFSREVDGAWSLTVVAKSGNSFNNINTIDHLNEFAERLRGVQIECGDFRKLLPRFDKPGVLMYLDPTYLHETRTRASFVYAHEMTEADHVDLLKIIWSFKHAKAFISGYDSPLYRHWLSSWKRHEFRVSVNAAQRHAADVPIRIECLWEN